MYRNLQRRLKQGPSEKAYYEMVEAEHAGTVPPLSAREQASLIDDYKTDLDDLRGLSTRYGFNLAFTNYPRRPLVVNQDEPPERMSANDYYLDYFCRKNGYLLVDLIGPRRAIADASYFADAVHPSPRGHEAIACILRDALLEHGKIPGAMPRPAVSVDDSSCPRPPTR